MFRQPSNVVRTLIGNLVESVKGQMNHETEVFTKIADARAKIGSSSVTSEETKRLREN